MHYTIPPMVQRWDRKDSFFHNLQHELDRYGLSSHSDHIFQGTIIDTIPFTSVAGQITDVLINKSYPTNGQDLHLMVAVDAGLSAAFDTWINPTACASCTKGRRSRFSDLLFTRAVETSKTGSLTDTNLVGIGYTHGVSLNYSIECDDSTWMCQFSNRLRRAMLYAAGLS